jgi:hypothetical protein
MTLDAGELKDRLHVLVKINRDGMQGGDEESGKDQAESIHTDSEFFLMLNATATDYEWTGLKFAYLPVNLTGNNHFRKKIVHNISPIPVLYMKYVQTVKV